jgi:MFS family permease
MKSNTSLASSLRSLPPAAWILFAGTFLNKFGSFVQPFLTLYMTQLGFSLADAGFALGAYGVGNVFASIIGGHLADHLGRRKTIVFSMFSGAATMLLLSQARTLPAFLGLSALAGFANEFYRPASSALLADLVTSENRVTAYSTYRMAINAGFAFGPATAGFLSGHGFLWLFIGDAATSVLFGIVALFALPEVLHPQEERIGWAEAARTLSRDRRLHRILLAALGVGLIFIQMSTTFSVAAKSAGFSSQTYGLLLSVNGAMIVFLELPLTRVTRNFSPMTVVASGFLVVGLGFGLMALAGPAWQYAACIALFTVGEMVAMPVSSAYIAGLSPARLRGRYMGSYGLTWTLAQIVGPGVGLALFGLSPRAFWISFGLLGAVSAAIALGGRKSEANQLAVA